jgi:diguanylate cyclase (GGDEF)-like protein
MDLIILGAVVVISVIAIVVILKYSTKKIAQYEGEVKLYKSANEYQKDAMAVFSEKEELIFANKSARKLLELEIHYENNIAPYEILVQVGNREFKNLFDLIEEDRQNQGMIYLEKVILLIDETKHRINLYIDNSKWNMDGSIICVFQDANSEFREKESIKKLAETDFLTGLPSQFRASLDVNNLAVESQKRSERFALCLFDISNFKEIKVSLGLAYTNTLLKKFAQFLDEIKQDDMSVYRLGCNNFILLINNFKREKVLQESVEEVSRELSRLLEEEYKDAHILSSMGVVLFPEHGKNANKLIDRAYIALEEANKKGKGSIVYYEDSQQENKDDEIKLSHEIAIGLQKKEFVVSYEPVYTLETRIVSGANIVIKWNHPRLGVIGKDKFMKIAESTGQSIDINNFIMSEVVHQRKVWNSFDFKNIYLIFEISSNQIHLDSFVPDLEELFADNKVDASDFIFDISSCVAEKGLEKCHGILKKLKKMGIQLIINNIDIGVSTMEELDKNMIYALRVDSSLLDNSKRQEVFKSIVSLAHALDIEVYVDNVKNRKQADMVNDFECDKAHGKHFSGSLAPFELQEFLR